MSQQPDPNTAAPQVDIRQALARAQAFNECISRHVYSLIETTKVKGAPNQATLIACCEQMLRKAWEAGERARV